MPELHGGQMLVASVAALALGPLIYWLATRAERLFALLDGFIVVAVLGLALLEIIPLGVGLAGWPALIAVGAGLLLPNLLERRLDSERARRAAAWLALIGMVFHAGADGLALAGSHVHSHSHAMEWAVILHRIPVGLAVWWMLTTPRESGGGLHGQRAALAMLALLAFATVIGFVLGSTSAVLERAAIFGVFEAFVGGLLLHVVSHGVGGRQDPRQRWISGVGGLLGLAVVLALFVAPELADGRGRATVLAFWQLVLESAPALLLAYGLAGVVGSVLGEAPARWLGRGGPGQQTVRGVAFGLPLPLCSCGVVPVYRSLVARGVPATAGLGFLVATPELGLDAVLISLPLLGADMAVLRVVVAFGLALIVGRVVGGWAQRRAARDQAAAASKEVAVPKASLLHRIRSGVATGYGEVLDTTGPWILVGLLLAAFVQPWVDADSLHRLDPMVQVLAFALIGLPVYVCATGATPLVAVLLVKGLSPGAALAFLLTGPATNATTYGVLEQLHGRRVALAFAGTMLVAVVALGLLVNALAPLVWPGLGSSAAQVHAHDEPQPFALACAIVLAVLFAVSLVRQGPRRFLGRLWEQGGHDHDHDHHDHCDDHDHDHDHHHHHH